MQASELVYAYKESPYSSHAITIASFPAEGNGLTVLDVGCGNGYLGAILASRGFEVTGIEKPGGYNASFPRNVTLVEADLERGLPKLDRTFHYILCADILEHLRRPDVLLGELRGILRPGGRLIASLPNSGNIYFRLNVLIGRFPQQDKGLFDRTHLRFYTWAGWKTLLEAGRFRIESVRSTAIPVGLGVGPKLGSTMPVRAAERICYDLARVWMKMFAYQFVVVAQAD
jgi:SAM-dependent methyltransferase